MIQALSYCVLLLGDLILLKIILCLYFPTVYKEDINTNQNKTRLLGVKSSLQFNLPKSISSSAALAPSTRIFFGEPWRASYIKYTPSRTIGRIFSAYPCKFECKCQLSQVTLPERLEGTLWSLLKDETYR